MEIGKNKSLYHALVAKNKSGSIRIVFYALLIGLFTWYIFCLPNPLFQSSYSTVIFDQNGELLNARTAPDGQWRFPEMEELPEKYIQAVITFEDKNFYHHPGVDPFAIMKAAIRNYRAGRVVSGGSTISMQVARMSFKKPRKLGQKLLEALIATRLEIKYTKEEILKLYASHAPFGGNVVGLEAASWRYFGKDPRHLTWAEAATMAVLPNAPSLIYPGKNREILNRKRDKLLQKLMEKKVITAMEYELSVIEPLPEKPLPLPAHARHLAGKKPFVQRRTTTSLDVELQNRTETLLQTHHRVYAAKGIHNAAVLVIENATGKVLIYAGNIPNTKEEGDVDMITAARSSGSILKPFLYAAAMDEGMLTPGQLMHDIPISIEGFKPSNHNKEFMGALPAQEALSKSLNIPAVLLLREYGVDKFRKHLQRLGLQTIRFSGDHYGLSLILGGAEVSLWDLCAAYSGMAQKLSQYGKEVSIVNPSLTIPTMSNAENYSPGTIYSVFESMKRLMRPGREGGWEHFSSSREIAWKTGTSYGHRDAWAIGVDPLYTVGVWVGNADGEGHPEIIGSHAAGQLLFEVFHLLPFSEKWFFPPHDDMADVLLCSHSGHLAGSNCRPVREAVVPQSAIHAIPCPYCEKVFTDESGKYLANNSCADIVRDTSWFVLPAHVAWYYKRHHADYHDVPALHQSCDGEIPGSKMALLYPHAGSKLWLTTGLNGERKSTVLKAVHSTENAPVFWHLNDRFLGSTLHIHEMKIDPDPGMYKITLLDGDGYMLTRHFEVAGRS